MMMRGLAVCSTFVSAVLFPWPLTALLACSLSIFEPLVPFAVGLFADTLYYVPQAGTIPLFTLYGIFVTTLAFLVRSRLKTSIIGE